MTGDAREEHLSGAVPASDLSLFGGVFRCEECRHEQPLADIAAQSPGGWPEHCGKPMTWVTLRQLAADAQEPAPEGFEFAAVPDPRWRLEPGKRCSRKTGARQVCGALSVAARNHGWRDQESWYPYCADHLAGRWIEAGQVMHWALREQNREDQ